MAAGFGTMSRDAYATFDLRLAKTKDRWEGMASVVRQSTAQASNLCCVGAARLNRRKNGLCGAAAAKAVFIPQHLRYESHTLNPEFFSGLCSPYVLRDFYAAAEGAAPNNGMSSGREPNSPLETAFAGRVPPLLVFDTVCKRFYSRRVPFWTRVWFWNVRPLGLFRFVRQSGLHTT